MGYIEIMKDRPMGRSFFFMENYAAAQIKMPYFGKSKPAFYFAAFVFGFDKFCGGCGV